MIQSQQMERSSPGQSDAIPKVRQSRLIDKAKAPWFFGLLVGCKILSALSTFLLFDFLQFNHEILRVAYRSPATGVLFGSWSTHIQILSVIQILSGATFIACQRRFSPWNKSLSLSRKEWLKVLRHAVLLSLFLLVWMYGLRVSGPFQAVIITAHYNFTLAGIFTGFFIAKSGVKLRGGVLFVAGILILLLFGNNATIKDESLQTNGPTKSSLDLESDQSSSTSSVSTLVLVACLAYKMVFEAFSKNVAADFGGSRRLHALSTSVSGLILLILFMIDLMSGTLIPFADMIPFWSNLTTIIAITLFGFVLEYYVDNICLKRLEPSKVTRVGTSATMGAALLYALLRTSDEIPNTATLVAFSLIYFGILSLTSHEKASGGGSFVGYSSDGLPLFNFSNHFSTDTYVPIWKAFLRSTTSILKQIQEDAISRKMFYFSLLTLMFTGFQFLYGIFTNSLGTIVSGFHMMFDTLALCIGLSASVICRWKPSKTFPFGYGRIEILAGFLNSLFLLVIAVCLMITSCRQLYIPVADDVHQLLPITFVGLFVKLIGIYIFKFKSSIGGQSHINNVNVKGVFLHILGDTMGSLGGIISTFLINNYGVTIVDPIISFAVASLILMTVIPLLTDTAKALLLSVPNGLEKNLQQAVLQILTMEGVKGYRNARFWTHASNLLTGSIHVQAIQDINEQHVIRQVNNLFNSMGFTHFTTQLEKDEFIARKSFSGGEYETGQDGALENCLVHPANPSLTGSGLEGFGSETGANNSNTGERSGEQKI